jgi:hypothetical protein
MTNATNLSAIFLELDQRGRRQVQLRLCQHALNIWEAYAQQHGPFEYIDSVVGMHHQVEVGLPREALDGVLSGADQANIAYRYQEPIVALQDDDLAFPAHIMFAYYAIYNLYRKERESALIDDWLIVNQALSAEQDASRWRALLAEAVEHARQ